MSEEKGKTDSGNDYFEKYSEYNRTLRSWFVAFGFGVPAVFLINEAVAKKLSEHSQLKTVTIYFLIGAASQVLIAFINKTAAWSCYFGAIDKEYASTCRFQFTSWLSEQFWIDFLLDIITIIVFGIGIWKVLTIFAA